MDNIKTDLDLSELFYADGTPKKTEEVAKLIEGRPAKRLKVGRKSKADKAAEDDREIRLTYANKQQESFVKWEPLQNQIGELLFVGGLGAAKTFSLCLIICKYLAIPNTKVLLCRLNLSDLKKSTLKTLLGTEVKKDGTIRPPLLPPGAIRNYNKSEGIIYLHNGSELICMGAANDEKVKSVNASVCIIEELSELSEDQYLAVSNRARIPCELPNITYAATNPKNKRHWIYQYFFINQISGIREAITVSTLDNAKNLPEGYIEKLMNMPELKRKQLLEGQFVDTGDLIFYTFDEEKHVKGNLNNEIYDSYLIGQDFGGGAGEAGMVLIGVKEGVFYILKEFCKSKTSHFEALQWMEQFRSLARSHCVYDSANAALGTDMENAGWKLTKSIKDLEGSFSIINDLFYQNRIIIDSSCTKLINQLAGAARNSVGVVDKTKNFDVIDAFRYGVCAIHLQEIPQEKKKRESVFIARF